MADTNMAPSVNAITSDFFVYYAAVFLPALLAGSAVGGDPQCTLFA
jgi:hypothetical protein